MTALVFVDTNVFLYARDPGEPSKQERAVEWLAHLWRESLGRTSVQILSEYYVNMTRKLSSVVPREEAWDEVTALFTWRPQPVDQALLQRAREVEQHYRLSWWDSMVVGAAQLQGCVLLLTEDLQDGAVFSGVTVRSPFMLDVREPAATYAAAPVARSRHRPRGRPKR
ncbi:MAG: PIN domain-containing protein [Betaproteobacteria bacterium]|nr:PIN domain-containing protein [Betaproteobacteria bacterium]